MLKTLMFLLFFIPNISFGDAKLSCSVVYKSEFLREITKKNLSVILDVTERSNGVTSFRIDDPDLSASIKIESTIKIGSIDNRSDENRWHVKLNEFYEKTGARKEETFYLDRNTGDLRWIKSIYMKYPGEMTSGEDIKGVCKKINESEKLF